MVLDRQWQYAVTRGCARKKLEVRTDFTPEVGRCYNWKSRDDWQEVFSKPFEPLIFDVFESEFCAENRCNSKPWYEVCKA